MAQVEATGTGAPIEAAPAPAQAPTSTSAPAGIADKPGPLSSVSELTADWLSKALSTTVTSFESERIGTGQVSAVYRLKLQYGADADLLGPTTMIFKVPSEDEGSRQAGAMLGLYERETRFYTEVAPEVQGGAVSKCYYSSFDSDSGAFSIVLSDAAPSTVGNEIVGGSLEQAKLAVRELGNIHGQAMRKEAFHKSDWLNRPPPINQQMMEGLCEEFLEIYKDQMKMQHGLIARQMVAVFDDMTEQWHQPDVVNGLIHGDYRLDNMLFGEEGADLPLTAVDWQTVTWGPFMTDFSYFVGSSLPTDLRRQHWEELLQIYYEALGTDPPVTLEQCKEGYRRQSFFGVTMGIISPIMVERTERGDKMFMTMFERICEQVIDLDAIATLPHGTGPKEALKPVAEDELLHPPQSERTWQESFYFDFIDAEQKLGGWIRLGIDPNNNRTWYTLLLCGPDRPTVAVVDFAAPVPKDDLRIQTDAFQASHAYQKPLESFHVLVDGKAKSYADPSLLMQEGFHDKGEAQTIRLYLVWKTAGIPYTYRLTTRYEIPCLVSGTVSIGHETFTIQNALGQRDHSWGSRDWWAMDWVWSSIHLNDSTRIHGLDLRVPNAPRLGMGYLQQPASAAKTTKPAEATIDAAPAEPEAAQAAQAAPSVPTEEASVKDTVVVTDNTTTTTAAEAVPDPPEQTIEPSTTNGPDGTNGITSSDTITNEVSAADQAADASAEKATTFSPLPLTDPNAPAAATAAPNSSSSSAPIAAAAPAPTTEQTEPSTLTELSTVRSTETFTDSGLIKTCDHVMEPGNVKVSFEPYGHAPLRMTADDGRFAMFPRAWGKVRMADGREGWSWMEWNRNNQ